MTALGSPFHDPDSHPLVSSPNDFGPLNIPPHGEFRSPESNPFHMMPSILEASAPDLSNIMPMETTPVQTIAPVNSTPLLPWPGLQPLSSDSQGCYDYRTDQGFTSNPIQSFSGNPGRQKPTSFEMWEYGTPSGSAHLPSSSTFWEDHSFEPTHDVTSRLHSNSHYLRPSFAPLPMGPSQQNMWGNSTVTNTMNEVCAAPRSQPLRVSAFDAADSNGPSLYTTTMSRQIAIQPDVKRTCQDLSDTMTLDSCETDSESTRGEPPYAKLIYNALMNAPEHKLVLRDIYAWISENTDKAKDPAFKGWQNSVRHNLSMNGV